MKGKAAYAPAIIPAVGAYVIIIKFINSIFNKKNPPTNQPTNKQINKQVSK
jgi:hypothetical protein